MRCSISPSSVSGVRTDLEVAPSQLSHPEESPRYASLDTMVIPLGVDRRLCIVVQTRLPNGEWMST